MKKIFPFVIFLLILVLTCTRNTLQSQLNPEIANQLDQFEFKITDVRSITDKLEYQWQNNGITANVQNFSNLSGGNATLAIADGAGNEVFAANLSQAGVFFGSAGATGIWVIQLKLTNVSGTLHFRIERRP